MRIKKDRKKLYQIYCDGSSNNSQNEEMRISATGFCLVDKDGIYDEGGKLHAHLSSVSAELQSVIDGIEYLEDNYNIAFNSRLLVLSDCKYVVNSINKWIYIWRDHKFLIDTYGYGKFKRSNYDQLIRISDYMNIYNLRAKFVRGHKGNEFNEYVHDIAYNKRKNKLEELNYD